MWLPRLAHGYISPADLSFLLAGGPVSPMDGCVLHVHGCFPSTGTPVPHFPI
uniref:Uncharacterized protein n=1 Tax=Romanomermis culicivorax TaxID=13658 RepID=A0A915L1F5_ROMCU